MRRTSSTSRSSAALLACLGLAAALVEASPARAALCLPPIFEDGQRLQPIGQARVMALDLLLRQHEWCWREDGSAADLEEKQLLMIGDSGPFGFPVRASETAWGLLNKRFSEGPLRAHIYNLGFVFTYQLKEALILNEALRYRPEGAPDVVVYGVTLADFYHVAPAPYPPLDEFFRANSRAVSRLAASRPAGLSAPLDLYSNAQRDLAIAAPFLLLRQAGLLLRVALGINAEWLLRDVLLSPSLVPRDAPVVGRGRADYDCRKTRADFDEHFSRWREWNILAWLESLSRDTRTEVLVLNWPIAHEPEGGCFNVRYPRKGLEEYNRWLAAEAKRRGLHYLDLHRLLPREDFVDSLHLGPVGHFQLAEELEPVLRRILSRSDRSHMQSSDAH